MNDAPSRALTLPGQSAIRSTNSPTGERLAAAAALLVLTSIAAVAIGLPTTTGKVTAGLLAAVGSALSGFLAKTFLTSYQLASLQLSYYYGQPLVHCYLLLADWLAAEGREEFGKEEGRLLLREVIDASVKAAADAQDHLLSMQEHYSGRRGTGPLRRPGVPRRDEAPVPHTVGRYRERTEKRVRAWAAGRAATLILDGMDAPGRRRPAPALTDSVPAGDGVPRAPGSCARSSGTGVSHLTCAGPPELTPDSRTSR